MEGTLLMAEELEERRHLLREEGTRQEQEVQEELPVSAAEQVLREEEVEV